MARRLLKKGKAVARVSPRTSLLLIVAILIETDGERIRSIFGVSNPDKLAAIAAAVG